MPSLRSRGRRSANGARARRPRRTPGPQSLLILHLDAEKLHRDGLHFGDIATFSGGVSALALGSDVVIKDSTSRDDLTRVRSELTARAKRFDVVVVVGHSNARGIRMACNHFADWSEFAAYLKPLGPRRLLLVACQAGRWDAGEALFSANRELKRIFACPVNASKDFGALMLFTVPYVVAERRPRDKHVLASQLMSVALTGRQLREWRRTTDNGNPDSSIFDLLADVTDPLAQRIPSALASIVRSVFGK